MARDFFQVSRYLFSSAYHLKDIVSGKKSAVKKSEGLLNKEDYVKHVADVSNTYPKEAREVHQKVGELFRDYKGNYPTVVLATEYDIATRLLANDLINETGMLGGQVFAEQVLVEIGKKNSEAVAKIHNSR